MKLVRYVSPFGSPASMRREAAEALLAEDEAHWAQFEEIGLIDERMRRIGPPRIDDTTFRLSDLPEWVEGDSFEVIRPLVQQAESLARQREERYVVAVREGRTAAFVRRLVIEGDDVRWETR